MQFKTFNLLLMLSLSSITAAQETTFQVMSFNIRLPNPDDGFNYWPNRKDLAASMIRYHEADIVGLQEAFRSQLDDLQELLPEYDWFGLCRTDGTTDPDPDNEFSAIFYRKDRFELLDGATFWLSDTPEQPGSRGWDAALPRIVTWAHFRDKAGGESFFHFNTHFDHMGEKARLKSARLLLSRIASIAGDAPVVLTGDFNCTPLDPPYRALTDPEDPKHLPDALMLARTPHHGPLGTWTNAFQFPGVPGRRIDFIFVKNDIEVHKHAILSDSWSGRLPSDHLPVLARLSSGG
jgi:endonuclease/exonuclease/phosphatase family metal-dependent hydrolase